MNLGAPILDVSQTVVTSSTAAGQTAAQPTSIVSGGTVSAPGYSPIVITRTVTNDPTLAANAAAGGTTTSGTTTTSTSTTSGGTTNYVSTDRVGSSAYGVIQSGGTNFAPNV